MSTTLSVLGVLGICFYLVHLSEQKYEDVTKCAEEAGAGQSGILVFRTDSKYLHKPSACIGGCSIKEASVDCINAGLVPGVEISNEVDWNSIKLFFNTEKSYFLSGMTTFLDDSGLRRTNKHIVLNSHFGKTEPPGPYSNGWSIKGKTTQKDQFVYWAAYEPDGKSNSVESFTSLILLELPDGSITMGAQDHVEIQSKEWRAFCMFPPTSACFKESIEEKEAANSSLANATIEVLNGGKAIRLHTFFLSSQPLKYEVAKDICQKNGKTLITNELTSASGLGFTKEDFKEFNNMLIDHLVKKGRAPGTSFFTNTMKSAENFAGLRKVYGVKDYPKVSELLYNKDPLLYAMCYSKDIWKTRADCTEKLNKPWKRVDVTKYASMSGLHKMADIAIACELIGMVAPVIDDYADWIHLQTFAIEKKQKLGIYNDYKWNEGAFVSTSGLTAYLLFWIDPAAGSMPIFQNNEKPAIQIDTKSYESKTYIFAKVVDPRTEPQTVAGLCMYPPGTICFSDQKAAAPKQINSKLQTSSVLNYEYGYWPEPKGYAESKELCSGITYDKYSRAPGPKKQWATPKEAESFYNIFWKFNFQHDVLPFPVTLDADDKGIHMISDDKWIVTHTYREYVKGEPHVQAVRVCEVYAPWGHCCE